MFGGEVEEQEGELDDLSRSVRLLQRIPCPSNHVPTTSTYYRRVIDLNIQVTWPVLFPTGRLHTRLFQLEIGMPGNWSYSIP